MIDYINVILDPNPKNKVAKQSLINIKEEEIENNILVKNGQSDPKERKSTDELFEEVYFIILYILGGKTLQELSIFKIS